MSENARSSWLRRNWKWLLGLGCVALLAIFIGGILLAISAMMKSSDVYRQAAAAARAAPAVADALGTPVDEGFLPTGRIHLNGPRGSAELAIPLSGPKDSGTLFLVANKSAGEWKFSQLVFATSARRRIDLLQSSAPPTE